MSASLDELHALITHLEEEEHALAGRFRAAFEALKADVPKLADEAKSDAGDVVHTAETQGVTPAVAEAEKDGEELLVDAGHDVAAAVEAGAKPAEPQPAHSPAQTAAVIAGEAAVATENPGA